MNQGSGCVEHPHQPKGGTKTMNRQTIVNGVFLAFCLVGMLVLPAAAAPVGQGTNVNANAIDKGLKDDLWNNHVTERMQEFNLHIQHATDVIVILNKYGIDTTQMQNTLNFISAKGTELQTALNNKDKDALKTINNDLKELWKQYLQEMRDSIKDHYGKLKAANNPSTTGSTSP